VPHQGAVQGQRKDGTPLVMLEAALNGARGLDEHPGVPRSPRDVAEAAAAAVDAGARAVHVHAFDQDGHETLAPTDNAAVLHAVRQLCPGVPISLTTRSDLEPDPRKRLGLIASWTTLPDLVTANQGEDGIVDICEHLIGRGVGIEAGLLDVAPSPATPSLMPVRWRASLRAQECSCRGYITVTASRAGPSASTGSGKGTG
jgi:uncharacterized protein (DUF849 family)